MLERVENEFGDCHFQSPFDAAGLPLTKGSLWWARQSTMHSAFFWASMIRVKIAWIGAAESAYSPATRTDARSL
jgi:hypothetical protein